VAALGPDQAELAENVLREYLNIYATDVVALEMLGSLHMRIGDFETAEELFKRAFELAPSFARARLKYISALHQQLRPEEEIAQIEFLLQNDPDNPDYRVTKATALSASGRAQEAVEYCEEMLRAEPEKPQFWLSYAQALRTAGRQEDCVAAFRKTLQLQPRYAAAWWGLANLKTFHFSPADVDAIRAELGRGDVTAENREFLHFALGEALEDLKAYEEAFKNYRAGNAVVRSRNPYDLNEVLENMEREERRFTPEFYAAHEGGGCPSPDPIFILGLPRSGSTLVEQILASHSEVEGC